MFFFILLITSFCNDFSYAQAIEVSPVTQWSLSYKSKARLISGRSIKQDGSSELYAAVEIILTPGWKTYWRHPGEAGGIAPLLEWSKSENLFSAETLFPKPRRFKSSIGDIIGYEKHVVMPVKIKAIEENSPINLSLNFKYGVCNEICIPVNTKFEFKLTPLQINAMPPQLTRALMRVPVKVKTISSLSNYPRIIRVKLNSKVSTFELIFDVHYPLGLDGADAFVESSNSIYLPITELVSQPTSNLMRYRINFKNTIDFKSVVLEKLRFTIVSDLISTDSEQTIHLKYIR